LDGVLFRAQVFGVNCPLNQRNQEKVQLPEANIREICGKAHQQSPAEARSRVVITKEIFEAGKDFTPRKEFMQFVLKRMNDCTIIKAILWMEGKWAGEPFREQLTAEI
jgi:hypothetical protein